MLTRTLSIGGILVALASPLAAQATHPDFSGTWVLDGSNTVIDGQMEAPSAVTYVVVQAGDSPSVDQKIKGAFVDHGPGWQDADRQHNDQRQ